MSETEVLIVGESPSLGRAVGDLLAAEGVGHRLVYELSPKDIAGGPSGRPRLVVVVSHGYYTIAGRRWLHGEMSGVPLLVVGSLDPILEGRAEVHRLGLPLDPVELVRVIFSLVRRPDEA